MAAPRVTQRTVVLGDVWAVPATGLTAVAPPSEIRSREHGVARPGIDIAVCTAGQRVGMGTDDLREGGIVR